jgi:hypothetical protein
VNDEQMKREEFMDNFTNREPGICLFAAKMAEQLGGPAEQYKPFLAACALSVGAALVGQVVIDLHGVAHLSPSLTLDMVHAEAETANELMEVSKQLARWVGIEDVLAAAMPFLPEALESITAKENTNAVTQSH